jgi:hypothetical protein
MSENWFAVSNSNNNNKVQQTKALICENKEEFLQKMFVCNSNNCSYVMESLLFFFKFLIIILFSIVILLLLLYDMMRNFSIFISSLSLKMAENYRCNRFTSYLCMFYLFVVYIFWWIYWYADEYILDIKLLNSWVRINWPF